MISLLQKYYFVLQVKMLVFFNASVLFERINQLDWYEKTLRQWIDNQNFLPKSKVLEVGCATGSLSVYIAKLGHMSFGVDSSHKMIEIANLKNNYVDFKIGNADKLPYESETFDAVVAASLINIVSDKSKVISELTRICKAGGAMTILVPSAEFSDENLYFLQKTLGTSGFSNAALEVWHKMPPKMKISELYFLFEQSGIMEISTQYYLQGMVVSISGRKKYAV